MPPTTHHIIPEGERYCIWMDAGVVDYKLCNLGFRCETCAFDAQIRAETRFPKSAAQGAPEPLGGVDRAAGETPSAVAVKAGPRPAKDAGREAVRASRSGIGSSASAQEHWTLTLEELLRSIGGRALPDDRMYASNHTWAKQEEDGSFALGVDHFIGTMLSGMHSVACSVAPMHVKALQPYAWIVANGETLAVRSPISGTIVAHNAALAEPSSAIHADPYGSGWIARILPEEGERPTAMMPADRFAARLKQDAARFERSVLAKFRRLQPAPGATMFDGGAALANFEDMLGTKRYYMILEHFLRSKR